MNPEPRVSGRLGAGFLALALLGAPPAGAAGTSRAVAVTFDDLPLVSSRVKDVAGEWVVTQRLLRTFAETGVPVTGFVNEGKLGPHGAPEPARVKLLEAWLAAGLDLGNHGFSHLDLNTTPLAAYQDDVAKGETVTRKLLEARGKKLVYFRHPFLHCGRTLETKRTFERWLADAGYRVAPVTFDNADWIFARAYDEILKDTAETERERLVDAWIAYVGRKVAYWEEQSLTLLKREPKQILLLHANELNADTFPLVAGLLRTRGYTFVTLEEALKDPAYRLPEGFVGGAGISWIHRWALTAKKPKSLLAGEPTVPGWVMKRAKVTEE